MPAEPAEPAGWETTEGMPFPALPRSVARLGPASREQVRELVLISSELEERRRRQSWLVALLRAAGVAWSAIGWSVGTSGEAARQRWGSDQ